MTKIYKVQMNSKGMPNFSTAVEVAGRPQGWIPCSERLPSESGYYLCCNNGYLPYVGHFINGRWSDFDCTIVHADAWMPLPKPYGRREGE